MKTSMKVFKTVTESKEQDPSPDIHFDKCYRQVSKLAEINM